MTREEIDRKLERLASVEQEHPSTVDATRLALAFLAHVAADQEQRLRALEPCPNAADGRHLWNHIYAPPICLHCARAEAVAPGLIRPRVAVKP